MPSRTMKTTVHPSILAACLCGFSTLGVADDVLLIGGGFEPVRSEGQIELNVRWVQQILNEKGIDVTTWFTDGNSEGADVVSLAPAEETTTLTPLARIFDNRKFDSLRYREHAVPDVTGGTDASTLLPALSKRLSADPNSLFLIYNGHGNQPSSNAAGASINLWNNSSLDAVGLHGMLEPRNAPFRWVFAQCYSGGFHRLAYDNPITGLQLGEAQRCGFTSESAYRVAESCSVSLDVGDYRDYTTYFFAALSGTERDGDELDRDPDSNGDGVTSPREAHLYTLEYADSNELSRSTSEDYLDEWQPWYLRWLPLRKRLPDNEYAELYRNLAARLGITLGSRTPSQVRNEINDLNREHAALQNTRETLRAEEQQLQTLLRNKLASSTPALLGPYTQAYKDLASSGELERIAQTIASDPDYTDLIVLQDRDDSIDVEMLDIERAIVQRQKLLRMRRLAHLSEQLDIHGDPESQRDYASLVSCEEVPLTSP